VEAIELIESRYADPLGAADLAAATGVSPSHLRKIFRRLTGQAPLEYLASVRIQHACRLLLETDLAVTEIAGRVGWSDPNLFARRFRAILGLSPRAYRTTRPQPGNGLAEGGGRG
jgi:AraC-like DNA-binding protein